MIDYILTTVRLHTLAVLILPWFWDSRPVRHVIPEVIPETAGYLCDCGWRRYKKWDAVEGSPFTWRIQQQPF
jgi:hypothetical protein